MKINTNSWHVKLHKYIFTGRLPDNLCPYFWRIVKGLIFVIPTFISRLPLYLAWLFEMLFKKTDYANSFLVNNKNEDRSLENMFGFLMYVLLLCVFTLISIEYHFFRKIMGYSFDPFYYSVAFKINIGVCIALMFYLAASGYKLWILNDQSSETNVEKTPNLLREFIKAKYHKYCPKIEWVNKNQNQ